jgi:DNA-binding MarR family transcriptional regulator
MIVPDSLDEYQLRILLQRVARRIRNNRSDESLSYSQMGVLLHLDVLGDSTPSSLASVERVTPPSMNRTVNGLEQLGLVKRTPSTSDARMVTVSITDRGRTLAQETRRLRTEWFHECLARLEPEARQILAAAVPILARIADE